MSLASSSTLTTRKATHARLATVLEAIPNVGSSIAGDLRSIGIKQPQDLIGRNRIHLKDSDV